MNDAMKTLPETVSLIEVGPRDGLQFESGIAPTEVKTRMIEGLIDAGLRRIQAVSFVHPGRVPQMADAEELLRRLPQREDVEYIGLVLNMRGLERALQSGLRCVEISISASDAHGRRNAGMSLEEARGLGGKMVRRALAEGVRVRAGIQCALGCVFEGSIPHERIRDMARDYLDLGVHGIVLADTTGMGTPLTVKSLLPPIMEEAGEVPMALHLHDTRGLGLVNLMAGLECGVTRFDASIAGMGGCPFVPGAAGNIATEDAAHLLDSLHIQTGLNLEKLAYCAAQMERFFQKRFPGRMARVLAGA